MLCLWVIIHTTGNIFTYKHDPAIHLFKHSVVKITKFHFYIKIYIDGERPVSLISIKIEVYILKIN